jgi:hypothetical protein
MKTIHLIENIHLDSAGVYAQIGNSDKSSVLFRNGELDNSSQVYSFIMLLIINQKMTYRDIMDKDCNKPFVLRVKKQLLEKLVGISKKAYTDWTFAKLVRSICQEEFSIIDHTTVFTPKTIRISKSEFRDVICKQVDLDNPVQITYFNVRRQCNMNAVVVGYSIHKESLRLYCLDPCRPEPYDTYWNNIIDIYVNKKAIPDYCPVREHGIILTQALFIYKTVVKDTSGTKIIELFPVPKPS